MAWNYYMFSHVYDTHTLSYTVTLCFSFPDDVTSRVGCLAPSFDILRHFCCCSFISQSLLFYYTSVPASWLLAADQGRRRRSSPLLAVSRRRRSAAVRVASETKLPTPPLALQLLAASPRSPALAPFSALTATVVCAWDRTARMPGIGSIA